VGFGFALAVPVLPLGNISLGLAIVYTACAAVWFALFASDSRTGLLFLLGPVLAPAQALALVPALVGNAGGLVRRAFLAAASVAAAIGVAALTSSPLPFTGGDLTGLDLSASPHPGVALGSIESFLSGHPALWIEAAILAAAAVAVPYAQRRGLWGIAAWGAGLLAAALLAPWGSVDAFPLVLWVWTGAALLAVPMLGVRR
jgi:hypothetical protein